MVTEGLSSSSTMRRRWLKTFGDHPEIGAETDADYKRLWIHRNKNNTSLSE